MSLNTILATAPLTTQNYILKATGTTIGNSLIFDNGTNVGIGNTNTSYTLDVSGTGRFTSSALNALQITNTGVGHGMTGWAPTNTVASLGSYDASGNFAIMGFSSSASQNGLSLFGFIGVTDPTDSVAAILLNAGKKSGTGQAALGASETTFQLVNGGIGSQITVLGSGNVGIGTSSPSGLGRALVVTNTSDYPEVIVERLSSGAGKFGMLIGNSGDFLIRNYTAGTNPMLITSGGNVLIGTSTDGGYKLEVVGTFKVGGSAYFTGSVYNYVGANRFFASGGTINYLYSGSASLNLVNQADTGTIGTFNGTTGVYTATSDINKKKDFELSTLGLDAIMGLKPTLYRIKSENGTEKHLGFIAQEVKDFIPQAFVQNADFIGLTEMPIVAALTKAVQELKQELDTLKNK